MNAPSNWVVIQPFVAVFAKIRTQSWDRLAVLAIPVPMLDVLLSRTEHSLRKADEPEQPEL
jgi:hypothetical protein